MQCIDMLHKPLWLITEVTNERRVPDNSLLTNEEIRVMDILVEHVLVMTQHDLWSPVLYW